MTSYIDVRGNTWTFTYDSGHRMLVANNPLNQTKVRNEYDAAGRVTQQFDGNDKLVAGFTYNANGSTTVTDASGHSEVVYHDDLNVVAREEDALGEGTEKGYDANFRPTRSIDPLRHASYMSWSAEGTNLTQVVDAAGNQTDMTYDSYNNVTGVIDAREQLTQYFYEDANHPTLLTRSVDASGGATSYTYTSDGYLQSVTDPLGHITQYTYDSSDP
jgi:YD repeat-containing protein